MVCYFPLQKTMLPSFPDERDLNNFWFNNLQSWVNTHTHTQHTHTHMSQRHASMRQTRKVSDMSSLTFCAAGTSTCCVCRHNCDTSTSSNACGAGHFTGGLSGWCRSCRWAGGFCWSGTWRSWSGEFWIRPWSVWDSWNRNEDKILKPLFVS